MSDDSTTDARPLAFAVLGGGTPSAEELAAITVALTPVRVVVPATGKDGTSHRGPSGWARAALVEGIGGRPAVSLADLEQGRFGLGHVGDPATSSRRG